MKTKSNKTDSFTQQKLSDAPYYLFLGVIEGDFGNDELFSTQKLNKICQ